MCDFENFTDHVKSKNSTDFEGFHFNSYCEVGIFYFLSCKTVFTEKSSWVMLFFLESKDNHHPSESHTHFFSFFSFPKKPG